MECSSSNINAPTSPVNERKRTKFNVMTDKSLEETLRFLLMEVEKKPLNPLAMLNDKSVP